MSVDQELHRTAGASAVGARRFLIAYNVYLERGSCPLARPARSRRERSARYRKGYPGLKREVCWA